MEVTRCSYCTEEVTTDSDFCPHCGVIFESAGEVTCDFHPSKPASGVCIICRNTICRECGVRVHGRIFCQEHRAVKVQEDWAEVFHSNEIAEAELVKSVLESTNHKLLVQNFNSIGYLWDGGGDSIISRSNINMPAKVFVPIPEYLDAAKEIDEWRSARSGASFNESETE